MAGSLQQTGVEAVVEGLTRFKGDVDSMNSKIGEIGSKGNILTRALGGAWEMLENFGASAVRIAEYALGQLLARAIEFVIGKLRDLVQGVFEAGAEFQAFSIRLNRLNFNAVSESVTDYDQRMQLATKATKEQLDWIQKLAVQTPYDAADITNVYTLARSYQFAAEESKALTQDITDFASGMGLGNTEIERIIINFGQMKQQGKVTGTELKDLARGAFVPVNDILDIMRKKTGLTGKAFDKFKSSTQAVNMFMNAFSEIVAGRFKDATKDMARTWKGATDNVQDFFKSIIGLQIVKPVLDSLGGSIADMVTALTEGKNWEELNKAAARVGASLQLLFKLITFGGTSAEGMAEKMINALNGIADWIYNNRHTIANFFKEIKTRALEIWGALKSRDFEGFLKALGLDEEMIGKIVKFKDGIVTAFNTIRNWVDENGPLIKEFFGSLGNIIGGVFKNLTGGVDTGGGLEGLLGGIKKFMEWVTANQEGITNFVTGLTKLWLVLQVVGFVLSLILPPIMALIGFVLTVIGVVAGVVTIFGFLTSGIGLAILAIAGLIAGFILLKDEIGAHLKPIFDELMGTMETMKPAFSEAWETMGAAFLNFWEAIKPVLGFVLALLVGIVMGIVQGLAQGLSFFYNMFNVIVTGVSSFIAGIVNVISGALNIIVGLFTLNGEQIWEGVKQVFLGIWQIISGAFLAIVGLTIAQLGFLIGFIKGFVEGVIGFFKDLYHKLVGGSIVPEMLRDMVKAFVTFFGDIATEVATFFTNLYTDFVEGGADLVQGLIDGLAANWNTLITWLTEMANSILSAVTNALGISSPSKEFEHVGEMMIAGLIKGIRSNAKLAQAAMLEAMGTIAAPAMNVTAMPTMTLAPAMAGSAASVSNTTTNNFGLTVNSPAQRESLIQDYGMLKSMLG